MMGSGADISETSTPAAISGDNGGHLTANLSPITPSSRNRTRLFTSTSEQNLMPLKIRKRSISAELRCVTNERDGTVRKDNQ